MKNIFRIVIVAGFAVILGSAGNADVNCASFASTLLLSSAGVSMILAGLAGIRICNKRRYRIENLRRIDRQMRRNRELNELAEKQRSEERRKNFCLPV